MATALVTGASRGIGRAIAVALSRRGDRVAVHYGSDAAGADATLGLLDGSGHLTVGADLSDPVRIPPLVDAVTAELGPIDLLVNNAAVAPSPALRHHPGDTDLAAWRSAWRAMLDVGLIAAADLSFLVAGALIRARRGGVIVNVGSRGAFRGEPDFPAYAATKAGLHALGQSLAVALAPHDIAVVSVAPGFVATERQEAKLAGPTGDAVRAQSPFGRVGTPEEIAAAVVYLTSAEARWASGAVLDLNGASYLRT